MKKRMAGLVALLIVAGVSIGVAKGVFRTGETSQAAQTPVLAAEKKDEAAPVKKPAAPVNQKTAMALMEEAAKANKYLFGFFWKTESEQTTAMKKVFEVAIAKVSERATAAVVQVTDPAEREIVKKFGLDRRRCRCLGHRSQRGHHGRFSQRGHGRSVAQCLRYARPRKSA